MATVRIVALDEVDSTNAEARRRSEEGEAGPLWITARRQIAGRGRRGRAWETAEGNLAATYLFTTSLRAADAAQVSFVAALAVADLACVYIPAALVSLKWPNDLLIAGKKAAGVLVESGTGARRELWVAVGIGVNLARAPMNSDRPVTSLAEYMPTLPPAPLDALEVLSGALERWRGLWEGSGFGPIAEAWTKRAHGIGQPCVAHLALETVEGIAEGLDADGALRLRTNQGEVRRITAGDVYF